MIPTQGLETPTPRRRRLAGRNALSLTPRGGCDLTEVTDTTRGSAAYTHIGKKPDVSVYDSRGILVLGGAEDR